MTNVVQFKLTTRFIYVKSIKRKTQWCTLWVNWKGVNLSDQNKT